MKKITVNPQILSGKPIFEGTRIPVDLILEFLSQGNSIEKVLEEYPSLTKEDILGALNFAAKKIKEEKIYPISL
jgi:uncharacterized protein (DUF433 family)